MERLKILNLKIIMFLEHIFGTFFIGFLLLVVLVFSLFIFQYKPVLTRTEARELKIDRTEAVLVYQSEEFHMSYFIHHVLIVYGCNRDKYLENFLLMFFSVNHVFLVVLYVRALLRLNPQLATYD